MSRAHPGDALPVALSAPTRSGPRRAEVVRDVGLGVGLPALAAWLLQSVQGSVRLWPSSVILAVVVVLAVFVGFRAALIATIAGAAALWWTILAAADTDVPSTTAQVASVALFLLVAGLTLVIVERLNRARDREEGQRRLVATVLEEAPVGIALFDRDLRFRRVNRRLCEINGRPAEAHLGRRASEVLSPEANVVEPFLRRVLDSGEVVSDRLLSVGEEATGTERHFRVGYFPVYESDHELVGVGATVQEVTTEMVTSRRAERLLGLAEDLAGVADQVRFAEVVARFLADALSVRAVVALVSTDESRLEVRSTAEPGPAAPGVTDDSTLGHRVVADETHPPTDAAPPAWLPLDAPHPLTDAVRRAAWVDLTGDSPNRRIGACVPLRDALMPTRVMGALEVVRADGPPLSASERTLVQTASSAAALALSRIHLAELAARDRFRAALEAMIDDVAIATAIRDADGAIVDFRIEFTNRGSADGAGRGPSELSGRRVLDLYPGWVPSGMFDRFVEVVETGEPWVAERMPYDDATDDGRAISGFWSLRVARLGDGYIAASRDVSEAVHLEEEVRRTREEGERQRLTVELLQQAALPTELPERPGWAITAHYQPASGGLVVGGDWYDAFALPGDRLGLVIADVAGHGPESAAFMVQVRNWLRAVSVSEARPAEVLTRVNEIMLALGVPFVTCCYATLDVAAGLVTWSSAGHLPPLLLGDGAELLPARHGPPLGVVAGATYGGDRRVLRPGDALVLYTDGLVERRREGIDTSLERLRRAGADLVVAAAPPEESSLVAGLCKVLLDPETGQDDDVAVLCVERACVADGGVGPPDDG